MSLSFASPKSRKLALIIGQYEYQYLDKLALSKPDAELMHETLQNLGFQTFTPPLIDKTNEELTEAFFRFSTKLEAGDVVFFYYSGHANQQTIDDKTDNYIFGIDAKEEIKNGVKITADACRIFPNKDQRFKAGSTSEQCQVQSEMNLIPACLPQDIRHREYDVVYACQPGFGAIEDPNREVGYLASALSHAMNKPGSWGDAVTDVIQQVQMESGYRQKPSVSVNISKKLYFKQNSSDVTEVSTDQKANFVVPRPEIPTDNCDKYEVQVGDGFFMIAEKLGVEFQELVKANPKVNPDLIFSGQILNVPPCSPIQQHTENVKCGGVYTVKFGDTFFKIALDLGITLEQLTNLNPQINDINFISIGQEINIPPC